MKTAAEIIEECKPAIDEAIAIDKAMRARFAGQPFSERKHAEYNIIIAATAEYTCNKIIARLTELLDEFQNILENPDVSSQDRNLAYQDLYTKMSKEYAIAFPDLIELIENNQNLQTEFKNLQQRLKTLGQHYTEKTQATLAPKYNELRTQVTGVKRRFSEREPEEGRSVKPQASPVQKISARINWDLAGGKPFAGYDYTFIPQYRYESEPKYFRSVAFIKKFREETMKDIMLKFNDSEVLVQFAQQLGFEIVNDYAKTDWSSDRLQVENTAKGFTINDVTQFCRIDVCLRVLEKYAPGSKTYFSNYFQFSEPSEEERKTALRDLLVKKVAFPELSEQEKLLRVRFPFLKKEDQKYLSKKYAEEIIKQTFHITEAIAFVKLYDDVNLYKCFCENLVEGLASLIKLYNEICNMDSCYIKDNEREKKQIEWQIQFEQYIEGFDTIKQHLNSQDPDSQALIETLTDKIASLKLEEEPKPKKPRLF